MAYRILITPAAQLDLEEYTDSIAQDSPEQARKWLTGAWEKIFSLSEMPRKYAVIAETEELGIELRDFLHHSHRIVYSVDEEGRAVVVLRVWPSARRGLSQHDISE